MKNVLVVDDKEMMRDSVATTLRRAGFEVEIAADAQAAIDAAMRQRPGAVVTDMRMPGMTGIELIERLRSLDDDLPVILMTAFGTIETAVKAMKLGAFDYLTKPFEGDELIIAVKRAMEHRRLVRENALLRAGEAPRAGAASPRGLSRLRGESAVMQQLREQIAMVASSQGTVLITGESGVGKELVARAVHECGPRGGGPFLAVNCAALSESLLESELFGHERGAFTGAERLRKGRFELADAGSLLLDEVSEVKPQIQAKLLRVLQERSFERVGSSVTIGVDVRVIATSNRDLTAACAKGDFRQDLYFRLNVLPIRVPSLRERAEDVPALAEYFVRECAGREGRPPAVIDAGAADLLRAYRWPGNVRELQNVCERASVLSATTRTPGVITRDLLEPWLTCDAPATPSQQIEAKPGGGVTVTPGKTLDEIEREAIVQTLVRLSGHRQKTAKALGIGVRTLGLKLKKWKQQGLVMESL
ncbi:MAG: acetoacetate metabolism regulatory protein AtoC [Phycisphaerae bacterium]|nr:MAG: acetoacetate metabolism regulatory protein AtoC [Phycisphaerae bacterium]